MIDVGQILVVLIRVDDTARARIEVLLLLRAQVRVVLTRGSGYVRMLELIVVRQLLLLLLMLAWIERHLTAFAASLLVNLLGMRRDERFFLLLPTANTLIFSGFVIGTRGRFAFLYTALLEEGFALLFKQKPIGLVTGVLMRRLTCFRIIVEDHVIGVSLGLPWLRHRLH